MITMRFSSFALTFYGLFVLAALAQARHDHRPESTNNGVLVPVLASAVGILSALLITAVIVWALKSHIKRTKNSQLHPIESEQRRFSYSELVKMTNNFERRIGVGGFGTVYYGNLNGAPVAVKIYRDTRREYASEVNFLTRIHHRNLINLVGYCNEANRTALIFEFMANGDLRRILTGSTTAILSWEHRLRIAIDVAKALDYLHDGCKPAVIHRDVKSSNILMSENLEPKLSGFSLAVSLPIDGASHVSTVIAGTVGYLDPEYVLTGQVKVESDVYSFGLLLMEIITNQSVHQIIYEGEERQYHSLSDWVSSMFAQGEVGDIVDPRLEGDFDICSAEEALKIAMACASGNSGDRPTMDQVVVKLKDCLQMELSRLNEVIPFDSMTSISIM